jgi:hypothetical protein
MYISVMLIHYRQYSTQRDYTQEEYNDQKNHTDDQGTESEAPLGKHHYENLIRKEVALIVILITYK